MKLYSGVIPACGSTNKESPGGAAVVGVETAAVVLAEERTEGDGVLLVAPPGVVAAWP